MSSDSDARPPALSDDDAGATTATAEADASVDALEGTHGESDGVADIEDAEAPDAVDEPFIDRAADWFFAHWADVLVGLAVLIFFRYYRHLTIEVHQGYGTSAFDIGVFDQGTYLLSRFKVPYVTLTGRNLFADHSSFILALVAPLYWFFPGPETLLTVQAAVIALAAVPIYLVGRKRIGPPLAAALAIAYLLHPALNTSILENYHPDSFMALFVALMLWAAIEDKRVLFVVSTVLAMMVKEDAILVVLPIALWYAWRRNWLLGGILAGASVVWTALVLRMIHVLNHNMDLQGWRIPYGGPTGFLRKTYQRPGEVFDYVRGENRPFYVWQMLAPTGFVFLVSPEIAATGVLILGSNTVSAFVYQHLIGYHYVMPLVPILAMGTVWAVSRLKTQKRRRIATAIVMVCSVWTFYLWTQTSVSRNKEFGHWLPSNPVVQETEQIRKQLPKNAVASVYHSYAPHVDHRQRIYMWPVPWHAVYWRQLNQEGQTLPFTNDIQYLMLPTTLSADDQKIFDPIKSQFEVVASNSAATLYKRVRPG